ncbi:lytic transglycosylase (plasmid) [Cupriavidus sp. USMAA2-4]|uniref:transglycosylase SLT domain-containing protein n=1 Tax=Cupriavidus sp. USMAA2-4 TaxID=876364 RepID=UPI0008A69182|nr:transglycosylase SLT domain-containing protein [Cupriavidus sp. USMAA2-4]AOY97706.1 lytic transglycosylase [Cupriavidus sp. USMAA2-4]
MLSKQLLPLALGVLAVTGYAASIEAVVSPTALVVREHGTLQLQALEGKPVLYCGLERFAGWAARWIGTAVTLGGASGPQVEVDGRKQPLRAVFASAGWLRPPTLDDGAQAAMAERRGGWACASKVEPFAQMRERVDPAVLASIAMNESSYRGQPWPWTLNVAGQGFFFASREDAYAAIQALLSAKRCDFDVGLMQVNWCFHGKRFGSAWDALAPATNIRAAESILLDNRQRSGSSMQAVAWYHSANPSRGGPYLARFLNHLKRFEAQSSL